MKKQNIIKTFCFWRCEREPDSERTKLRREKKKWEKKKEREGREGSEERKKQQTGKEKGDGGKKKKKAPCQALETVIHGDHLS